MPRPFPVDVFSCRGTSYAVGHALAGHYRRTRGKRAERPQGSARIARLDIADARAALLAFAPNVWEELHGIADGLGMPFDRAVAAFSNGRLEYPVRGCSSVLAGGLFGRNYDFAPKRYDRALVAIDAAGTHASVGFADRYTGRLDGMNRHGLCVALHHVDETRAEPGLVCILVVRILLDRCATTAEAVALCRTLPHGLAFNYSVMDASGDAAVIEAAPGRVAVRRGEWLVCTNHFQAPEMAPADRRNTFHSRRRVPPLEGMAAAGLDADGLFRALNDARSPAFHHAYAAGWGTLHTIVGEPAARRLLVGIGCDAAPATLDIGAWAAGAALEPERLTGRLGVTSDRLFYSRDMAGAEFRDVSLARARFDDIDFSGAEITSNCNFRGMTIAGVALVDLLDAWEASRPEKIRAG